MGELLSKSSLRLAGLGVRFVVRQIAKETRANSKRSTQADGSEARSVQSDDTCSARPAARKRINVLVVGSKIPRLQVTTSVRRAQPVARPG